MLFDAKGNCSRRLWTGEVMVGTSAGIMSELGFTLWDQYYMTEVQIHTLQTFNMQNM